MINYEYLNKLLCKFGFHKFKIRNRDIFDIFVPSRQCIRCGRIQYFDPIPGNWYEYGNGKDFDEYCLGKKECD